MGAVRNKWERMGSSDARDNLTLVDAVTSVVATPRTVAKIEVPRAGVIDVTHRVHGAWSPVQTTIATVTAHFFHALSCICQYTLLNRNATALSH